MSSIIYIRNDGDDFTPDQLELLHKYSDQALVWAHLFLRAEFIRDSERWREVRQEVINIKQELEKVDPAYAKEVIDALKKPYIDTQKAKKTQDSKDASSAVIPPYASFPNKVATTPEQEKRAQELATKLQSLMTDLYPAKSKARFRGLRQSPGEEEATPDPFMTAEEVDHFLKKPVGKQLYQGQNTELPPFDMAVGWAVNHNIPDAEEFASDCVQDAIRLYNPHMAEDTGVGYEGRQADFGTLLYKIMQSRAAARRSKFQELSRECPQCNKQVGKKDEVCPHCKFDFKVQAPISLRTPRELSLSQPTSEETGKTIEDYVFEEGKKEGIDFTRFLEPLKKWVYEKVQRPGSKYPQKSADILLDVYKRKFIDGERLTDIALGGTTEAGEEYSYVTDRPRQKEIKTLRDLGIDVSSLPDKLPPGGPVTEDRIARQRLWVSFFKDINDKIAALEKKEQKTEEEVKELGSLVEKRDNAKEALDSLEAPDVAKVHNILWGHPIHKTPHIMEFLYQFEELKPIIEKARSRFKKAALEEFLGSISRLRVEGELNYSLLRNKIQQKLTDDSPQLFAVYTYLYENDFSNPDTARIMKLSPPRITGLKKKIVASLFELSEIQNLLEEPDVEADNISPLRRFLYKQGDTVKVQSINEIGSIQEIYKNDWFKVKLNNGNEVLTVKDDIQKYCTLINSANATLDHYFGREVITQQCYLALTEEATPKLTILELKPISTLKTSARLYINNNLVDITEITEKYPDNLYSILKGHVGVTAQLETPFTPLFEQVEEKTSKLDKKLLKEVEQMDTEEQASLRKMFFQEFYNSLTIDQKKEWQEISVARHKKDPKREEMWQTLWAKLDEKQKAAFREYHQLQGHTQTDIEYKKKRKEEKETREREQAQQPSPEELTKIREQVLEEQHELRKKGQDNGQERI